MKKSTIVIVSVASALGLIAFWPTIVTSPAFAFVVGGPEMYSKIKGNHAAVEYCVKSLPSDFTDAELDKCYDLNRNKF